MTPHVAVAEERARLAAADLLAAANALIGRLTMKPEDTHDEVDAAVLSRRFTSYALSGRLEDAWKEVDFASRAQTEIESISASLSGLSAAAQTEQIGRLNTLAAECERRAVALRL